MVLVKAERYKELYGMIKDDAVGGGTSVLMLVATDCDSLCACRILSALLQADSVLFTVKPVSGYEDLNDADAKLIRDNDELKSIIMINCGATIKILDFLALKSNVLVYLIDSHRPYVVDNVLNESNIVILDDGVDSERLRPILESKANKESNKKRAYREDEELRDIVYEWATSINRDSLDELLWYAIVGMTDQLVHEHVSVQDYSKEATKFQRIVNSAYLTGDEVDAASQADRADFISIVDEFRFPLYRHWNLYDSMYHSRYVATNMGLWKPNGRTKLDTLLARMGMPLDECKQKFLSMNIELKKRLKEMFATYAHEFSIPNLYYKSFQRQHGFKEMQSASDTVYAVTALLEADEQDTNSITRNANFFKAYDALSSMKDPAILRSGLELAIKQQQAIVRQGISIMEKKTTVMSGPFRYTMLTESPDLHFFSHPLALSRLALFLIDIIAKSKTQIKPLVIAALNEKKNTYLIVGIANHNTQQYNFKASLTKTINQTRASVAHYCFDGSVVEVLRDDVTKFLEYLHTALVE